MKIAILGTRGIPARYGGFETFAEELSARLVERGYDVTVYCEDHGGERPARYRGINLVYLPVHRLGPLTTILFDLACLWHARKDYDVVYMLGYGAGAFCFLPRLWGSEVWINMDGVEWARSKWNGVAKLWFRMMEAAAMRTPDRVIADAQGILTHLRSRHMRMPAADVIAYGAPVVETAPDVRFLDRWQLEPGKYYLIVCRLEPENTVREMVSWYLQSETRLPLVVVGGIDPPTGYVSELLRMNDGRVRFVGSVYEKDVLTALRWHSLGYFHGHTVGGTNPSLLEALGCGNVVIAKSNIYNHEVAGSAAFFFNSGSSIPKIMQTIESSSAKQLDLLKTAARERVRRKYGWNSIADSYSRLLHATERERSYQRGLRLTRNAGKNMAISMSTVIHRPELEMKNITVSSRSTVLK